MRREPSANVRDPVQNHSFHANPRWPKPARGPSGQCPRCLAKLRAQFSRCDVPRQDRIFRTRIRLCRVFHGQAFQPIVKGGPGAEARPALATPEPTRGWSDPAPVFSSRRKGRVSLKPDRQPFNRRPFALTPEETCLAKIRIFQSLSLLAKGEPLLPQQQPALRFTRTAGEGKKTPAGILPAQAKGRRTTPTSAIASGRARKLATPRCAHPKWPRRPPDAGGKRQPYKSW